MTLIEVMAAMAILIIALLGVGSGLVVAVTQNGDAARRSQLKEFARARIERLVTSNKQNVQPIPTGFAVGTFNPDVAPGTGGWVLDTFETLPGASGGLDVTSGPVIADGEGSGLDEANTTTPSTGLRATVLASPPAAGCGDPSLANGIGIFCREIHIEQVTANPGGAGLPTVPLLRIWVRTLQGGGSWRFQSVVLQKDLAR
jgi:type II secretory pathway pseudopilin PulG